MDVVLKFLIHLLFIVCFGLNYNVNCEKCVLNDQKDPMKNKLLESISLLSGIKFLTALNGFSYAVSICSDVSKANHPNASVTRTLLAKNTTTVLGRHNDTDIIDMEGNQLLLTYSGGDPLNESIACNNTKWRTLIFISCVYDADDINIDLSDPLNGGCFAVFHLKTSVSCPQRQSAFFKWVIFIFLGISAYFACGVFYKRYVEGAKGWEQVPHQEFLRDPIPHLMGCLKGKEEIPRPQQNVPNDLADEPLLRP